MTRTTNFATFLVQACSDAHIGLMERVGDTLAYEVVIGGSENTRTAIRRNRQTDEVTVETPEILSCDIMRPFWISWYEGLIEVGEGDVYAVDRITSWQDPEPITVAHVAITTWNTAEGFWQFTNYPSKLSLTLSCSFTFNGV